MQLPRWQQVKNWLDAIRRKLQPSDSADMLHCVMHRYSAGEICYFRAEGRRVVGMEAPNAVYSSHPRPSDRAAGIVMDCGSFSIQRSRRSSSASSWLHAFEMDELVPSLDSCVFDLAHEVNRYGLYVAISERARCNVDHAHRGERHCAPGGH